MSKIIANQVSSATDARPLSFCPDCHSEDCICGDALAEEANERWWEERAW